MRCVRDQQGKLLGVYREESDGAALDELARDYGFADFAAWRAAEGVEAWQFVVDDATRMVREHGRKLFGPTYRGYAWFDVAANEAKLAAEGRAGDYDPHPYACSAFYLTAAEATMHALQD